MKLFTQLALVSAIAVSSSAMAMQAMDDAQLSSTTGQDGISLTIKPPVKNFDVRTGSSYFAGTGCFAGVIDIDHIYVHDNDGLASISGDAGTIVLDGFSIAGNAPIGVNIDADGNAGAPVLNVEVVLPSTLVIRTGDISVGTSGGVGNGLGVAGTQVKVLNSMDINMGGSTLNIQLGNETQGAMIKAGGTIGGGLSINNFALNDANSGGAISVGNILIRDNGGADLTIDSKIDATATGLSITAGGKKTDILLTDVVLGASTAASLGDIEISGMDMVGTVITVSGH